MELAWCVKVVDQDNAPDRVGDLKPLLAPRVVAVIGASRERRKVGSEILHNILASGFIGQVVDDLKAAFGNVYCVDDGSPYAVTDVAAERAVLHPPHAFAFKRILGDGALCVLLCGLYGLAAQLAREQVARTPTACACVKAQFSLPFGGPRRPQLPTEGQGN